jgi:hypothetical protein
MHTTLIPFLYVSQKTKTKPTQVFVCAAPRLRWMSQCAEARVVLQWIGRAAYAKSGACWPVGLAHWECVVAMVIVVESHLRLGHIRHRGTQARGVPLQVLRLDAKQITAGQADTFAVRESSATARVDRVLFLRICRRKQLAVVKFAGVNPIKFDTKTNHLGMSVSSRDWQSHSNEQEDGKNLQEAKISVQGDS